MVAERIVPEPALTELSQLRDASARLGTTVELEWLPAESLHIDHDHYQRPLRDTHVKRIAGRFDPGAFGVLEVSEREDKSRWVLDGQHRVAAVIARGWGARLVPCLVHRGLTLSDEAIIFYKPQATRRSLKPTERFRARLTAGDEQAIQIRDIARRHGYELALIGASVNPDRLNAVGSLEHIQDRYGTESVDAVLAIARDAFGSHTQPQGIVLRAIAIFDHRASDLYDRPRLVKILREGSGHNIESDGVAAARLMGMKTDEATAMTIHRLYNHGLKRRLPEWANLRRGRQAA